MRFRRKTYVRIFGREMIGLDCDRVIPRSHALQQIFAISTRLSADGCRFCGHPTILSLAYGRVSASRDTHHKTSPKIFHFEALLTSTGGYL